ncbi:isoform 2 of ankyrin repeat-containing protein npr4 [Fagus crenata]
MEDLVIEKVDPMEDMTNPQRERMEDLEDLVIEKVDMTNPQRERMEDLEDLVIEKVEPMENEKVDAMEDEKVDEMVVPSDEMEDLRKIYQAAMKEDWDAMKKIFKNNAKLVLYPMTVDSDTPFHIAAYSGRKELLQYLCDQLKPSNSILKALSQKNNHGNNTFHEVATTNIVEAADFLVRKLREAHHDESDDLINDLLEDRNKLGETPLYMAATLGHTKMAKFLAKFVDDISRHFQRYDGVSILHLAVLGQHFDTAIWLLRKDKNLATDMRKENVTTSMGKENEGLTCLQLLAKMPSSFRSSSHMHKLKKFLYFCLPDYMEDVDDDHHHDEAQTSSSQMRDLERGQSSNSLPKSKKRSSGSMYTINNCSYHSLITCVI